METIRIDLSELKIAAVELASALEVVEQKAEAFNEAVANLPEKMEVIETAS